jgi:hypothetical protein
MSSSIFLISSLRCLPQMKEKAKGAVQKLRDDLEASQRQVQSLEAERQAQASEGAASPEVPSSSPSSALPF